MPKLLQCLAHLRVVRHQLQVAHQGHARHLFVMGGDVPLCDDTRAQAGQHYRLGDLPALALGVDQFAQRCRVFNLWEAVHRLSNREGGNH